MNPSQNTAEQPQLAAVPLNLLRMDNDNVRTRVGDRASEQADAELTASIRAQGLLENLVVVPRGKTQYGVVAGGRRYRALKALVEAGDIPKDHPVSCLVIDRERAAESSLAENVVRIAMHPVDQVVAFSRLAKAGSTGEQIAARFGVSERTVQKRIRLGSLPDEILAAYRDGRINADTAEAFATTGDTDFQRSVFEALSHAGQLYGHAVRHALAERHTRSDSPAALLVGLDAYRAAGGTTEDPLFDDDYVAILDPDLMQKLALDRLGQQAEKYADGWRWTSAQIEFTWMDQQKFMVASADVRADFTAEEAAALEDAEAAIEQASEILDDPDTDAQRRRELWNTIAGEQKRYSEIERDRADRDEYSEPARAHAGVVVAIDREGNTEVHRGLVRTEDADAYRAAIRSGSGSPADDPRAPNPSASVPPGTAQSPDGKKNGGYTDALRSDFRIMRSAAVRQALARDPGAAADLLGFVLARQVGFGRRAPGYETPVLAIRKDHVGIYASDAMKASATMKHLEPQPDVDLAWLAEDDAATAFKAYRALPDDQRDAIVAHTVACLLLPRLAGDADASGAHEQLVRDLGIDFPQELAAVDALPFDADLVWNRMNKGLILGAGATALGTDWADTHSPFKKKDLADAAARAFAHDPSRDQSADRAATRWLPPGFEPADLPSGHEAGDEPQSTAAPKDDPGGDRDADSLPAFLEDD